VNVLDERLVRLSISTAVQLLEMQDGMLYPIAHAIDEAGRTVFVGAYNGGIAPHPRRALETLRARLRAGPYRSTVVTFGVETPNAGVKNALCLEFESLDAAPETIFVPFVITRPWLRQARVITYAPIRTPGHNHVLRGATSGAGAEAGNVERTPPREKE